MYEYCLHGVGEDQYETVGAAMARLNELGKQGWHVCLSLAPSIGIMLERQYEPVQADKSIPTFLRVDTQQQRNQLIQDIIDVMSKENNASLPSLFSVVERTLFHTERLGYVLVPPHVT